MTIPEGGGASAERRRYVLDRDKITWQAFGGALFYLAIYIGIVVCAAEGDVIGVTGHLTVCIAAGIILAAVYALCRASLVKRALPEAIALGAEGIEIDADFIPLAAIVMVYLTPPTYWGRTIKMTITTNDGRTYRYKFGKNRKRWTAFARYEDFVETLARLLSDRPDALVYDL